MLQTEPTAPPITGELQMLVKRLVCLRENFKTLADDFGVHSDKTPPQDMDTEPGFPDAPGLDALRTEITRINSQVTMIEELHERLWLARTQLFGLDETKWQATSTPMPDTPGNYADVRKGDFRSH